MRSPLILFLFFFLTHCAANRPPPSSSAPTAMPLRAGAARSIRCRAQGVPNSDLPARFINNLSYYPESPVLLGSILYYVEYSKHRVMSSDESQNLEFWNKKGCGPAAIIDDEEEFLVACYDSNSLVRLNRAGQVLDTVGPFKGINDFTKDAKGGFFFSASGVFDADLKKAPIEGKIYHLSKDKKIRKVADRIHYANGLALTPNGKFLLVSEHLENRILLFKLLHNGKQELKNAGVFADLNEYPNPAKDLSGGLRGPDGMRVSPGGVLFVAQYGGSRILKFSVREKDFGRYLGEIRFQSPYPNTDNVWVTADGTLYGTAVEESLNNPDYPGIVYKIHDPRLEQDQSFDCKIEK